MVRCPGTAKAAASAWAIRPVAQVSLLRPGVLQGGLHDAGQTEVILKQIHLSARPKDPAEALNAFHAAPKLKIRRAKSICCCASREGIDGALTSVGLLDSIVLASV
jgi:hypothetical protein